MPSAATSTPQSLLSRLAYGIAAVGMFAVFAIFIYGVLMRHLGHPQSWVDESVTILSAWLVFWTSAFVLRWSEFIAFDMLFRALSPLGQRISVMSISLAFVAVIGWCFYGIVDYVMFMRLSVTDMLVIRMDYVYSIFVIFLAGISLRLLILCWRLAFGDWRAALADLAGTPIDTAAEPLK